MSMIAISNIVNVSLVASPSSLANYAINNLVCFTKETPAISLGSASYAVYATSYDVGIQWGTASAVYTAALAVFAQSPNIKTGGGLFIVVPMLTNEVLSQAISRAEGLVYFGGCSAVFSLGVTGPTSYTGGTGPNKEALLAAAVAEADKKLLFLADDSALTFGATGLANMVKAAGYTQTRVLFHNTNAQLEPFKWSYASRGMSTNFSGSNTSSTMQLKELTGVTYDSSLSQTQYTNAGTYGTDLYANIAGENCVISNGENGFFDDVYNLNWLLGALEVAGFNFLRTTGTKVPQTESGMDGLKGAYRKILAQAATNRFIAPGTWTGVDTFGDTEDFIRNIADFGYYIYSSPISSQSTADRNNRIAPVIQIAIKYAGAIHQTSVIVNVNR